MAGLFELILAGILLVSVVVKSEHVATHSGLPAYEKNGPQSFDIDLAWEPEMAELKTISLSLKKSSAVPARIPVYGMRDGVQQQVSLADTRRTAFYQDTNTHGAISITSYDGEKYHQMKGSFVHEGEPYEIEPFHPEVHKRSLDAKQGDHIIKKREIRTSEKVRTDYIMPEKGSEAYERLERIKAGYESQIERIYNDEEIRAELATLPPTTYTVQIYMVIDHTMYNDLKKSKKRIPYDGTVEEYVLYYLGHIANEIDERYRNIDTSKVSGLSHQWTMSTKLSYVYIATKKSEAPWISKITKQCGGKDSLNAGSTLDTLWDWAKDQPIISDVDAVMLLTRLPIYYQKDCDTIGLAYVGTVCEDFRVSVNEWWDTGVYTHELGHNLGAGHDSGSCADQYVMNAFSGITQNSNRGNTWRFSDCSVREFDKQLKDLNKKTNCLKNPGNYIPSWADDSTPPLGTVLSLDEQCKLYFGKKYKYANDDSKICYSLNCQKNSGKETKGGALQYTPCASGKWCVDEECVDMPLTHGSTTLAPCPGTDPETVECKKKNKDIKCAKASKKDCKKCEEVREKCCIRCRKKGVF